MDVVPVTPDKWRDLVALFERKGPRGGTPIPANCWCMWWRQRTGDAAKNKAAMRTIVREGRPPGLLAYDDGAPVGWISVGPRDDFCQLVRSRTYGPMEKEPKLWSIVCFYVDPRSKKRGVATELLEAAIDYAVTRGAAMVEAYPHERGDFMGAPQWFERVGFERVRSAGKRTIMRYNAPKTNE